jgi:hypothetical protein
LRGRCVWRCQASGPTVGTVAAVPLPSRRRSGPSPDRNPASAPASPGAFARLGNEGFYSETNRQVDGSAGSQPTGSGPVSIVRPSGGRGRPCRRAPCAGARWRRGTGGAPAAGERRTAGATAPRPVPPAGRPP